MNKPSAWVAGLAIMLAYWSAIIFGVGGWTGRLVLLLAGIGAGLWGLFRLVTYRPEYVKGAGTLEEVRRSSRLAPADEPELACPPDPNRELLDAEEKARLTG